MHVTVDFSSSMLLHFCGRGAATTRRRFWCRRVLEAVRHQRRRAGLLPFTPPWALPFPRRPSVPGTRVRTQCELHPRTTRPATFERCSPPKAA